MTQKIIRVPNETEYPCETCNKIPAKLYKIEDVYSTIYVCEICLNGE
jgi:predicted SprT family Zn-dependent metalloprotease